MMFVSRLVATVLPTSRTPPSADTGTGSTEELATPSATKDAAKARDRRLRALVQQQYDAVWRTLRRFGVPQHEVDDATQKVFVVAARRLDEIAATGERAYLMGIAVRIASETRRTLRRRREDFSEDDERTEVADPTDSPEGLLDRKRARMQLDLILAAMPFELRTVFVLREIEDLTLPEIASSEGIPLGTATSRLRRAKEIFRKLCADGSAQHGPAEGSHG